LGGFGVSGLRTGASSVPWLAGGAAGQADAAEPGDSVKAATMLERPPGEVILGVPAAAWAEVRYAPDPTIALRCSPGARRPDAARPCRFGQGL
jgi:hypothetical protein